MSIFICLSLHAFAQPKVNYNEDDIEPYVLPELLTLKNGETISTSHDWENKRKPEIFALFKEYIYGHIPEDNLIPSSIKVVEQSDSALDNTAIRKQIEIVFKNKSRNLSINILLYLPKDIKSPPVFVGYNFFGNQSIINDRQVIITNSWVQNNADIGITENKITEESRGKRNHRWPVKKIISEGFGLATIYYGDVDPDKNDFSDGIHPFYYDENQIQPKDDEWGSISAWAWGMSKSMDFLKQLELLNKSKFVLFGHSRLGKTALWAGALDERFDIVISNNSGCGGAALFRRNYGETVSIINQNFPHWFSNNFNRYSGNEAGLPIDQHMLIALIAPRPVYIASAEDDKWADPKGEYLSGYYASPVYELYGKQGLIDFELPPINQAVQNDIGYHIRTGKHDVTDFDWDQFMNFAKKHFSH